MKKRILPALLALCMVMSLLPTMVFAEAKDKDPVCCSSVPEATGDEVEGATVDGVVVKTIIEVKGTKKCKCPDGCRTAGCGCVTVTEKVVETEAVEADTETGTAAKPATKTTTITYTYGDMCTACKASAVCNPCTGAEGCKAENHKDTCPAKCTIKGCTLTASHEGKKHTVKTCTKDEMCAADGGHQDKCPNGCELDGCKQNKDHTQKHDAGTECPDSAEDKRCSASTHGSSCTLQCDVEGCTKTVNHTDKHEGTACTGDSRCPAAATAHTAPVYEDEDGEKLKTEGCPCFVACSICSLTALEGEGSGYSPKAAKHTEAHDNDVCLGYVNDTRCGATTHIAGCPNFCTCAEDEDHANCTHEAGCPVCAEIAACDCPACNAKAGPGLGVVTDNEGNEVDPAEPTEPTVPEVPEKAADFTDIDGDDAGQEWLVEAVQTMLDNGWMQGVGGSKFEPGVDANTGMVLTVVARMYGEKGIEGADYANLAKAWAEKNDLAEGIDLESDTIARKDIILLLWRLAGKTDSTQALEFTDVEGLEGDYLTALKWAVEKGIVKGNGDGTVSPDGILTRGQLAALVARYADNVK